MDDFLAMGVDKSLDELIEVVLGLCFGDSASPFHHLVESVIAAKFEDDVDVFTVLENMIEKHNIVVFKRFVNLDLSD